MENARTLEWVELRDVYFGEVWMCAGQSNMQMTVGQCFERDAEGEVAESYPLIRLFTVGTNTSTEPLDDVAAPHQPWSVAGREVRVCVCVYVCVYKDGHQLSKPVAPRPTPTFQQTATTNTHDTTHPIVVTSSGGAWQRLGALFGALLFLRPDPRRPF